MEMLMLSKLKYFMIFSLIFSSLACNTSSDANNEEEFFIVPPGKADNFYSDSAQEYGVSGLMVVELDEDSLNLTDSEKLEKAIELAQIKTSMLMAYLNEYVIDKSDHSSHPDYGGLHAMARADSFEPDSVFEDSPGVFSFNFSGIIGGTIEFMDFIEHDTSLEQPQGGKILKFGVPILSTSQLEAGSWKYTSAIRPSGWDASEHPLTEVEYVPLTIIPQEISGDGYIDYNTLYADGKLSIGIHFGYDYNDAQYEIQESKEVFDKLKLWGFTMPVTSFEDLNIDSGLFTKTITANGKNIDVEIKLVHARMVDPDADAGKLKASLIDSFLNREVVLFNGHAGFSGRFLPANFQATSAGNITSEEMWAMDLPTTYQVILVNGCDTYGKFADNFRLNPAKQDSEGNLINVDVVTSTSFAWLGQMGNVSLEFIKSVTGGYSDIVNPLTWDRLLTEINWGVNSSVFFGVHGIDDNPRLHPWANSNSQCQSCEYTSQCGNSQGNKCIQMVDGNKYCAMKCLDDSACPTGMNCQNVSNTTYITSKHCVPSTLTCSQPTSDGPQKPLIINELLFDPAPNIEDGDTNGDGLRSATQDEFIELVNIGTETIDLSGYTVADSVMVRFVFPQGTTLPPNSAVLVFGGGDTSQISWPSNVNVFACEIGLSLNNSGDTVFISDQSGLIIDSITYSGTEATDRSLTRATEKDPESPLIPHPGQSHSAGYAQDGSEL
jgi:Lamin Tail Domain